MVLVATAMLCKEQGITITGVCAIYEIFVAQKVCTRVCNVKTKDLAYKRLNPSEYKCKICDKSSTAYKLFTILINSF